MERAQKTIIFTTHIIDLRVSGWKSDLPHNTIMRHENMVRNTPNLKLWQLSPVSPDVSDDCLELVIIPRLRSSDSTFDQDKERALVGVWPESIAFFQGHRLGIFLKIFTIQLVPILVIVIVWPLPGVQLHLKQLVVANIPLSHFPTIWRGYLKLDC